MKEERIMGGRQTTGRVMCDRGGKIREGKWQEEKKKVAQGRVNYPEDLKLQWGMSDASPTGSEQG